MLSARKTGLQLIVFGIALPFAVNFYLDYFVKHPNPHSAEMMREIGYFIWSIIGGAAFILVGVIVLIVSFLKKPSSVERQLPSS